MKTHSNAFLEKLKQQLGSQLRSDQQLQAPPGLSTQMPELDQFLLWNGIPKGELTLFTGALGFGATSLWVDTARALTQQKRWVAWINGSYQLFPLFLYHQKVDLAHVLLISPPRDQQKFFWVLQELMSSDMFDLIGCDLEDYSVKIHQLRKLSAQTRKSQAALVFLQSQPSFISRFQFSLILNFQKSGVRVERAQHRPTPHFIHRRWNYARFMPEFAKEQLGSLGGGFPQIQSARAIP